MDISASAVVFVTGTDVACTLVPEVGTLVVIGVVVSLPVVVPPVSIGCLLVVDISPIGVVVVIVSVLASTTVLEDGKLVVVTIVAWLPTVVRPIEVDEFVSPGTVSVKSVTGP